MDDTAAVDLVTTLVCRVRRVDRSQVPPDADLSATLGFDSLDTAELLAAIHRETSRPLAIDSLEDLRTVARIAQRIVGAAVAS